MYARNPIIAEQAQQVALTYEQNQAAKPEEDRDRWYFDHGPGTATDLVNRYYLATAIREWAHSYAATYERFVTRDFGKTTGYLPELSHGTLLQEEKADRPGGTACNYYDCSRRRKTPTDPVLDEIRFNVSALTAGPDTFEVAIKAGSYGSWEIFELPGDFTATQWDEIRLKFEDHITDYRGAAPVLRDEVRLNDLTITVGERSVELPRDEVALRELAQELLEAADGLKHRASR